MVVTTSGTAVANLLPSVVEADQSEVPLVLLTADRPPELRGADANQTIRQAGIFRDFVRDGVDLPAPSLALLKKKGSGSLVELVTRTARSAVDHPRGPIHVNVPLRKPLQPASPDQVVAVAPCGAEAGARTSQARTARERRVGAARDMADALDALTGATKPLVVAGPSTNPGRDGAAIVRFARRWRVPVMADPLSGARFEADIGEGQERAPVLGAYDHYTRVASVIKRLRPDLILRTGRSPTSAALERALAAWSDVLQIVIDDGAHAKDHQRLAKRHLAASAADVFRQLARIGPAPDKGSVLDAWTRRWQAVEDASWRVILGAAHDVDNEGAFALATLRALPPGSALYVSSSMPVRDIDAYGPPEASGIQVLGNRGASGIDGMVSSVLGAAAGGEGPVVGLLGDLAFYHDMNGLLMARDQALNVVFVLVDNDGGGIFHMLPIREFEPVFTRCFATPHGLDFEVASRLYGLAFQDVDTPAQLQSAVAGAVARPGTQVIRVRTDRERNRERHEHVRAQVARQVQRTLNPETT